MPKQPKLAPPPAPEEKPLTLIGMEQTPKGWVPVTVVIRGDRVQSKQTHGPPQMKQFAAPVLQRLLQQKVLFPNGR